MLTPSTALPIMQFAFAVAIGTVVLALCGRLAASTSRSRPRRRRPECTHCGRRPERGGPPLLYFRDLGLRCTDCVRGNTARPQRPTGARPQQSTRATVTIMPTTSIVKADARPAGAGEGGRRTEEVHCHVAA